MGFVLFFWWLSHQKNDEPVQEKSPILPRWKKGIVNATIDKAPHEQMDNRESFEEKMVRMERELVVPIVFYGKVVDGNGNPIEGATVKFLVSDTSETGTTEYPKLSGNDGQFFLDRIKGGSISVYVSKRGYYSKIGGSHFEYNTGSNHIPDPNNPVIFQLRRKGEAAELIKGHSRVPLSRDGTPSKVNLITGKPSSEGHFTVQVWSSMANASNAPFDWKVILNVPDGGLLEFNDEFPFLAPENGYTSSIEINMPASLGDKWPIVL